MESGPVAPWHHWVGAQLRRSIVAVAGRFVTPAQQREPGMPPGHYLLLWHAVYTEALRGTSDSKTRGQMLSEWLVYLSVPCWKLDGIFFLFASL